MQINSHKDLIVWQKSIELVVEIYALTEKFPISELYSLTSQMRRAAVSISSNIAEGRRRGTRKDFRSFLLNSFGSGAELETQLEIVKKLPFGKKLNCHKAENLLNEIMRMLNRMIYNLQLTSATSYKLQATSSSGGFTLIELIIGIAIIALIGVTASIELINYQRAVAVESAAREITGELRLAQRKAVSGEDGDMNGRGDAWGVRFSNPSGAGGDNYKVFYGTSYTTASTTATIFLPSSVYFVDPTDGVEDKDVIFTKLTGTATPATIVIRSADNSKTATTTVATSTISVQ